MLENKNLRWFIVLILFTSILFLSQNYRLSKHFPSLVSYVKLTTMFEKNPEEFAKHLEGKEFDLKRVLREYETQNAARVPSGLILFPNDSDADLQPVIIAESPKQEANQENVPGKLPKSEQLKKEEEVSVKKDEAKQLPVEKKNGDQSLNAEKESLKKQEGGSQKDAPVKKEEALAEENPVKSSLDKKDEAAPKEIPAKKNELAAQTVQKPLDKSAIVNPHDFNIILDPGSSVCGDNHGEDLFFLIYVHTNPSHVERREFIRKTWASTKTFPDTRIIFTVGRSADEEENELLADENSQYNDILQEDFADTYRNLTYKAVMAVKWISTYCEKAKYILKTDDDVVMDVYRLRRQLKRMMESHIATNNSIICFVYRGSKVFREKEGKYKKWYVSPEEHPGDVYDDYCDGPFFIITTDLIPRLYNVSFYTKFFWVDDVYLTGQLARIVGAKHYGVNHQVWSPLLNLTHPIKNDTFAFVQLPLNVTRYYWQNITLLELDLFLRGASG